MDKVSFFLLNTLYSQKVGSVHLVQSKTNRRHSLPSSSYREYIIWWSDFEIQTRVFSLPRASRRLDLRKLFTIYKSLSQIGNQFLFPVGIPPVQIWLLRSRPQNQRHQKCLGASRW